MLLLRHTVRNKSTCFLMEQKFVVGGKLLLISLT
ncbi:hypothetical protein Goklo_029798 [Gossypium klotzschianum]|uniref:Uncharacterized protein n=1 Tax=Gossypium klotzschianum TaxID=34286 RepID=A0A7J8W480_9ROSI|nr:hypothetical protein [Gossypium klotzschianum]